MDRQEIITNAIEIASEYGGNLTVRQLYYQFVARGLLGSGQKVYKRVVSAVAAARLSGAMPFDWIVDRTRSCENADIETNDVSVSGALEQAKEWITSMPYWAIRRARWYGQRTHVTVGVEKEALAGVFEQPCKDLGVGIFVFRGYASLSSLWEYATHLDGVAGGAERVDEAVLLYFGDHDPDGWEIPRSAVRRIEEIAEADGLALPPLRLERVALTMPQIRRYNPPPFEAKVSSSRYAGYIDEHGTDEAWELDALRPDVLQRLIRDGVNAYYDNDVARENRRLVQRLRDEVRRTMQTPEWITEALS